MEERRTTFIIGTTVVAFVGLLLAWVFSSNQQAIPTRLAEVTDRAAIDNQVTLSHIGIASGSNFAGQKIRVINGTLKNISDKPLRRVEMKMTFVDDDGKSVQETIQRGFDVKQKPLDPGGQFRFETNFENIPPTWNHRIPNIEIVKIAY